MVQHRTSTLLTQVRFPGVATDFYPSQLSVLTSYVCPYPPPPIHPTPPLCTIACIFYAHVKDPIVHVRVRWITETLKLPVCAVAVWSFNFMTVVVRNMEADYRSVCYDFLIGAKTVHFPLRPSKLCTSLIFFARTVNCFHKQIVSSFFQLPFV